MKKKNLFFGILVIMLIFNINYIYPQKRENKPLPQFVVLGTFSDFHFWVRDEYGQWSHWENGNGPGSNEDVGVYRSGDDTRYTKLKSITISSVNYEGKSYILYDLKFPYIDNLSYQGNGVFNYSEHIGDHLYLFNKMPEFNIKTDIPTVITLQAISYNPYISGGTYPNDIADLVINQQRKKTLTFTIKYDSETGTIRFRIASGEIGKQDLSNYYYETSKENFFSVFPGAIDGKKVDN